MFVALVLVLLAKPDDLFEDLHVKALALGFGEHLFLLLVQLLQLGVELAGLDNPERRAISMVPHPSAVARMTLARAACFCAELRSRTIASNRRLSSAVTVV